jgi:antirestriction protein ArdC
MTVYDIVTDKILELLEQGEIPWKKPWKATGGAKNLISKKPYRGINQFLLNCSPYSSPYWLTYRQAQEKGGHIRKGEKSMLVVFWKWIYTVKETTEGITGPEEDQGSKLIKAPMLRYYQCFNLEQTEGIPHPVEEEITHPFTPIEQAEQIIANMPQRPDIRHGSDMAAYSPAHDYVVMPNPEVFATPEGYYDTLFHELSHSTGHICRLGRKGIMEPSYFGSHDYSAEELVAQFSSSMLMGHAGIEQDTIENSAAYIQGWLKALKGDKKLAIIAAGQAQKAADFILRREFTEEQ